MRIGLVINILNEEYQISVFNGIRKQTEKLGIELICFQSETINFVHGSFAAKIPQKDFFNLDGVILLTSSLVDTSGVKTKAKIEKLWGKIPVVSIGQEIENVPSFLIETDDSMRTLIEHLILHHHYKKFIYLSGPDYNYDAVKRESIFVKTIEKFKSDGENLAYILKRGFFDERAALEEMNECYRENPDFNPDVVVCANDSMAIGVYKFFKMNRENPKIKECAVTGFDDIPKGRYAMPSLTTIHQPLEEIGEAAVCAILKLLNKEQVPEKTFIESRIIYRDSCGCKDEANTFELSEEIQAEHVTSEELLRLITRFGQELNYGENSVGLKTLLNLNARQLELNNFCLLSFPYHNKSNNIAMGSGNLNVKPLYVCRNGKYYDGFGSNEGSGGEGEGFGSEKEGSGVKKDFAGGEKEGSGGEKEFSIGEFYKKYLEIDENKPKTLVFKFLNSGAEIIGCILYDAPQKVLPYVVTMAIDISQFIVRMETYEERRKRAEYLEKEVTARTAELVESNNKRMAVEAEVLKISELERQRFSTDLHDDICQRLAGISMLCRSYSKQENGVQKNQMDELADLISETLQITRQYAHNSYPVELESLGMDHSLSNLCNSFEKQSGIKCNYEWKLKDDSESDFDKMKKLNIFRIIQEALHNAMKHSKAQIVKVVVEKRGKKIVVLISDDGVGFDKKRLDSNGIGLNSMQYRANQIGADFRIYNNKPHGTCVELGIEAVADKDD